MLGQSPPVGGNTGGSFVLQDFHDNFAGDPSVKIPWVRADLCSRGVIVMEWINGLRCTDPAGIRCGEL